MEFHLSVRFEKMARAGGITNAVNVGIAVQADWENREFISHISLNVRRLFDFLVQFGIAISFLSLFLFITTSSFWVFKIPLLNYLLAAMAIQIKLLKHVLIFTQLIYKFVS